GEPDQPGRDQRAGPGLRREYEHELARVRAEARRIGVAEHELLDAGRRVQRADLAAEHEAADADPRLRGRESGGVERDLDELAVVGVARGVAAEDSALA